MQLSFHGAVGTVTGSRFLVEEGDTRVLVDCGLFQGLKALRERNWDAPGFDPRSLDAVVLTHAHIDHSGYLPLLVRRGYRGPIHCTGATRDLLGLLLPDAAYLQEEDAKFANRHGFSKHHPAEPLYTQEDVDKTLPLLRPVPFDADVPIGPLTARLAPAGHILGAATARITGDAGTIGFSGDVGRPDDVLMRAPRTLAPVDWLVLESTYGNRRHKPEDVATQLAGVVNKVCGRGGVLVVPSFAVGRAQALLHLLARGMDSGAILRVPIYLDSPMATAATDIFCRHTGEHRLSEDQCALMCEAATFVRDAEDSKRLSARGGPMIIVSASGMATGGRVLHHLKAFAPDRNNGILLVGYQAAGTRGEAILDGAAEVKIHGMYVPIEAERFAIDGLSAHADQHELIEWLRPVPAPRRTFLVHGEPAASDGLRVRLRDALGWPAIVPEPGLPYPLER